LRSSIIKSVLERLGKRQVLSQSPIPAGERTSAGPR